MLDTVKPLKPEANRTPLATPISELLTGALFGLAFGFLLQKGGVGKYHVLIGQLLLQDWTVAKIIITAIVVGKLGVFTLHHFAKVNLHIEPTRIGANIIGGLLFGAGFALVGYCPGTVAAALGQGNWDALFGMAGLIAGSWMFAELSGWTKRTIETWGNLGKVLLSDLLHVPRGVFVIGLAVALTAFLVLLEQFSTR